MQGRAIGVTPSLQSRDITLVNKHVNEVNKGLKVIPLHNLSEL